jgi:uncharacterized protein
MRDGPVRRVVKRVARLAFAFDLRVARARLRRRGGMPYVLGGECRRCAECCEAPAIRVGWAEWYLPVYRRLFLWWQKQVNGFELVSLDRGGRLFVFRCTHFDPAERRCDSYDSRPGICRDYPRALLDQVEPSFLPGCGYRAVARNADGLIAALDAAGVTPEQKARLARRLYLRR